MPNSIGVSGKYSFYIDPASNTVRLSVDEIDHFDSGTTGTLRLELWLTTNPWNPSGSNTGYEVANYRISGSSNGTLGPYQIFTNVSATIPYASHPPSGAYYVTLAIAEYTGKDPSVDDGYVIDSANSFAQVAYVNAQGGYLMLYPPVLVAQDQTMASGKSVPAESFIASATDKNNYPITYYSFRDEVGGGYFVLNGVRQAEGSWINVPSANLSQLQYIGSASNGTESINVAAYDGYAWSAYDTAKATTAVAISISKSSRVTEGNSASPNLVFTLSLTGPSTAPVSVWVDTKGETASAGFDYTEVHQLVTFTPGSTTATILVPVLDNTSFQPTRGLEVNLRSPTGATLNSSASRAYGVIDDNDTPADLQLPSDSGFRFQWFLYNVRAEYAWKISTGKGVKVGVFDQGIDGSNPDLSANDNLSLGRTALTLTAGGAPIKSTDNHGTAVAGVIGAARDGAGVVGVAYNATLVSIYTNSQLVSSYVTEVKNAFTYAKSLDVLNDSWGYGNLLMSGTNYAFTDNFLDPQFAPAAAALKDLATNGRGGLGTVVVQSSGNSYGYGDDTNLHNFQNSRYIVTVASTDYFGNISYFSTNGASILVSAPGGGGGRNYDSILTTDRTGAGGYNSSNTAFQDGTSFSAPVVSGVVALMLQANPNLGYRDVQQILAYTAHRITNSDVSWTYNAATGWNGGGLHIDQNQKSGFGQVDALAAVRLAQAWNTTPQTIANTQESITSKNVNQVIPDNGTSTGVHSTISVTSSMVVERVDVTVNITHPWIGDLSIWLTSPSGTTSNLLWRPAQGALSSFGSSQQNVHFTFDTVMDWGEQAAGLWTLGVFDNELASVGTLDSWTLDIVGHSNSSAHTFFFTNEYPSVIAANPSRGTISDPAGVGDVINAAALGSDTVIDLSGKNNSAILSTPLTITPGTNIKEAIGGAGNDLITANALGCILRGMDGNDKLFSGTGNDSLDGGNGIDTVVYSGKSSDYFVNLSSITNTFNIKNKTGADGIDTLTNIERLQFADAKIALDLDGNAGITAKILGVTFGKAAVGNAQYIGIGLNYLDNGWTYERLMTLAIDVAGAKTHIAVVNLLWTNLFGSTPTIDQAAPFVTLLDNGTYTPGSLGVLAADLDLNKTNINLVGLAQTGVEYS